MIARLGILILLASTAEAASPAGQVVDLVNSLRRQHGLVEVAVDPALVGVALDRARAVKGAEVGIDFDWSYSQLQRPEPDVWMAAADLGYVAADISERAVYRSRHPETTLPDSVYWYHEMLFRRLPSGMLDGYVTRPGVSTPWLLEPQWRHCGVAVAKQGGQAWVVLVLAVE